MKSGTKISNSVVSSLRELKRWLFGTSKSAARRECERQLKKCFGPSRVAASEKEAVVLCVVRNGATYVKAFVEHYRKLGFKHFFFIDNGSSDDTVERLRRYEGITVWSNTLSFKHYKHEFRNYLIQNPGRGQWCLMADIDEFIVLPEGHTLASLIDYLRTNQFTAVTGQMLEMFGDKSIGDLEEESQWTFEDFRKNYPYYDLTHIQKSDYSWPAHQLANSEIKFHKGGVRARAFGVLGTWLSKEPFFFSDGIEMIGCHYVSKAQLADFSFPILHYKFTSQFPALVARAVAEESYARSSFEYKLYDCELKRNPNLNLYFAGAKKLNRIQQLWDEKFVVLSHPRSSRVAA